MNANDPGGALDRFASITRRSHDIAVSYRTTDEEVATSLVAALQKEAERLGLSVFFDRRPDDNFFARDLEGWLDAHFAANTRLVASLCSDAYFDSEWCRGEFNGAIRRREELSKTLPNPFPTQPIDPLFHLILRHARCPLTRANRKRFIGSRAVTELRSYARVARRVASSLGNVNRALRYTDEYLRVESLFDRIKAAICGNSVVQMVGGPGAGKTRTAATVADEIAPAFPDGVWFLAVHDVRFEESADATVTLFGALCTLLASPDDPDLEELEMTDQDRLTAARILQRSAKEPDGELADLAHSIGVLRFWASPLGNSRDATGALVVLDNAETQPKAVARLLAHLATFPHVKSLATTQDQLAIAGCQAIRYDGLQIEKDRAGYPPRLIELLDRSGGRRCQPEYPAMLEFFESNDYNPMLIELTCGALAGGSFAALRTSLDRIAVPYEDRESRFRSLYAMIEYTFGQLSSSARRFLRMAVWLRAELSRGFLDWPDLQVGFANLARDLADLESRRLVSRTPAQGLVLREAVRDYLSHLPFEGEALRDAAATMVAYSIKVEKESGGDGVNSVPPTYLPVWRAAWPLFESLVRTAGPELITAEEALAFTDRSNALIFAEERYDDAVGFLDRFVRSRKTAPPIRREMQATCLAMRVEQQERPTGAMANRAFEAATRAGDDRIRLLVCAAACSNAFHTGITTDIARAERFVEACAGFVEVASPGTLDDGDLASFHEGVSMLRSKQGRFDESEAQAEIALAFYERVGQAHQVINCLNFLALVEIELARYDESEAHLRRMLDVSGREEFPYWTQIATWNLGYQYTCEGRYRDAWSAFEEFLQKADAENPDIDGYSLDYYAVLAAAQDDLKLTAEFRKLANAFRTKGGTPEMEWEREVFDRALKRAMPLLEPKGLHKKVRAMRRIAPTVAEALERVARLRTLFEVSELLT